MFGVIRVVWWIYKIALKLFTFMVKHAILTNPYGKGHCSGCKRDTYEHSDIGLLAFIPLRFIPVQGMKAAMFQLPTTVHNQDIELSRGTLCPDIREAYLYLFEPSERAARSPSAQFEALSLTTVALSPVMKSAHRCISTRRRSNKSDRA